MGISRHEEQAISTPPLHLLHPTIGYHETIVHALTHRRAQLDAALRALTVRAEVLTEIALLLVETLQAGHKVLVVGNGGSAAESQHFAAELVGRFKRDRAPYAALSLTTDTSILTAVANDYGYSQVFARQVQAFGHADDLLLAFSTSGESENILHAAHAARERRLKVAAVTGDLPSHLEALAHVTLRVPTVDTAVAQELHMMVTHILCDIAETRLSDCEPEQSL